MENLSVTSVSSPPIPSTELLLSSPIMVLGTPWPLDLVVKRNSRINRVLGGLMNTETELLQL